ncbi:MAG: hypothetical protein IRY95_10095 [Clostridia bacterium]|nr:hypothetical protein [Clostridia bacterium]
MPLTSLTLEFNDERTLRAAVEHLWERLGVTGELQIRRADGVWRLDLVSEKPLRPQTIERLNGRVVSDAAEGGAVAGVPNGVEGSGAEDD